jgi:hypothetical protein
VSSLQGALAIGEIEVNPMQLVRSPDAIGSHESAR